MLRIIAVWFALYLCLASSAIAFVVEGPRKSTGNAIEDLKRASRWAMTSGSLVETGQRGLGGGLEYSVDSSVCTINFIDDTSCEDAKQVISQALGRWADGHPVLRFTDVSERISPAFPLAVLGETDQGAEIDFYASTAMEFPNFQNALMNGYTIFYDRPTDYVTLSNNERSTLVRDRIESADVRVNKERCYYVDETYELSRPDCVHFPTLIFHEIGHALGLGHPEEKPSLNIDSDDVPYNPMPINCNSSSEGLKVSRNVTGSAVMVRRNVHAPGLWRRGLNYDDVAGRDALYPHCGIEVKPRFSQLWGSFARSAMGEVGVSKGADTQEIAQQVALRDCSATGQQCGVVQVFNGCVAYAMAKEDVSIAQSAFDARYWGIATAQDPVAARVNAIRKCNLERGIGNACRVHTEFCAFDE